MKATFEGFNIVRADSINSVFDITQNKDPRKCYKHRDHPEGVTKHRIPMDTGFVCACCERNELKEAFKRLLELVENLDKE